MLSQYSYYVANSGLQDVDLRQLLLAAVMGFMVGFQVPTRLTCASSYNSYSRQLVAHVVFDMPVLNMCKSPAANNASSLQSHVVFASADRFFLQLAPISSLARCCLRLRLPQELVARILNGLLSPTAIGMV